MIKETEKLSQECDSFFQYREKGWEKLWEFKYPDFPAKGFVRKFSDGIYHQKEIGRNEY